MSDDFEEMERIPWAALAANTPDPRRRLIAVGTGLVALIVLLLIAGRSLLGSEPAAGPELSPAAGTAAVTLPPLQPSRDPDVPDELQTGSAENAVLSEADLMASSVGAEIRLAEMWAEHFVRDFLTVDGDGATAGEAAQLIATELPESPATVTSFVEWVDTFAVEGTEPGRYRLEVAYRLLTGTAGSFVRQPTAAMAVTVDVDVDGTATFAGLPEVIALPEVQPAAPPPYAEQVPDWVLESVGIDSASVVGAYRNGSEWKVVLMSEVAPGVVRPHVVGVVE